MPQQNLEMAEWFRSYLEGTATEEEVTAMFLWLKDNEVSYLPNFEEALEGSWDRSFKVPGRLSEERSAELLQKIFTRIDETKKPEVKVHRIHLLQRAWVRYAAILILVLGLATVWVITRDKKGPVGGETTAGGTTHDVAPPQTNRAMLKLANGQVVYLDSAGNGQLAVQDNVQLLKTADGKIVYQESGSGKDQNPQEIKFNTLSNPRGSKVIDMVLKDGSHIWLNAGSSITFPVTFLGNERKVTITGEAYFEVAHDAAHPFKVVLPGDGGEVTVLGTHFNVNAYDDESAMRVTLLEGSVKVDKDQSNVIIRPGEQAVLANDLNINHAPDIEQVMAWKNGFFQFNNTDIRTVMRQLEKWYDLQVEYEGAVPNDKFGGKLPRDANLSQVLKALQQTQVHFRVDGKKLTVLP